MPGGVDDAGAEAERLNAAPAGKYQFIASLGQGGMADVYLAFARGPVGFNKLAVIKRLRREVSDDAAFRLMFLDEARLAARLNHPNVVQTYEVGEDEQSLFLAMEYLEGQPLSRCIRAGIQEGKAFGVHLAAQIVADALAGLHYAHELRDYDGSPLGIVHRDVSPQNIFVTYDGVIKIVDFGIAKASSSLTETEVGMLKGKVTYMAPEQVLERRVDRRADVFAMGIVLWELLTRARLMQRDTPAATVHSLLSESIAPPSSVAPGLAPELDAITLKALAREPEDRFQTAGEMRLALHEYLATQQRRPDELARAMMDLFAERRATIARRIQECMQAGTTAATSSLVSLPPLASDSPPSGKLGAQEPTSAPTASVGTAGGSLARPVPLEKSVRPRSTFGLLALGLVACAGAGWFLLRTRGQAPGTAASASAPTAMAATPDAAEVLLRLHGSNTIGAELAPLLAEGFLKRGLASQISRESGPGEHEVRIIGRREGAPSVAVEIDAEGSSTAFADLRTGACDIGMASRAIKPEEVASLVKAGLGDLSSPASEHVIGVDGIAVVVHPNNPIRSLTMPELRGVFTGETKDWSELHGSPGPIAVYARDANSGTYDTFKHLVLGGAEVPSGARRFVESGQLSDAVAGDPGAIGFIGLAYLRAAKALAVAEAGSAPLFPSTFTVATEDYPLSRRLLLYTPVHPKNPRALEFISFALSPEGQSAVKAAGFVDLGVTLHDADACGDNCSRRYVQATSHARRLSVDFRFQSGSTDLDSRALRDIDRLLAFLRPYPNARIALLGFSDAGGDPSQNLELSKVRARKVSEELAARGVHAGLVDGIGVEMPVASNATESGRQKNRRVEVWLAQAE